MKKEKAMFLFLALTGAMLLVTTCGYAQDLSSDKPVVPKAPPIRMQEQQSTVTTEKIAPGIFRIGEIIINKQLMLISFPAQVNMDKGLLEYLLVHAGGKTHESLLRTDIEPYNLQIAFLLLGFEGTDRPLPEQGSPETPKGESLEINVVYRNSENKLVSVKGEEWIMMKDNNEQKSISRLDWVFTGSVVFNGKFLAQSSGSIAAVYHDPAAIIDNASDGGESDERWYVKEGAVPAVGTPVSINIKAKGKIF